MAKLVCDEKKCTMVDWSLGGAKCGRRAAHILMESGKTSTAATSPQERNAVREKVKLKSVKLKKVAWWNRAQMSRMACGWDPHIWRNGEHAYVDGEIEHDFILSGN